MSDRAFIDTNILVYAFGSSGDLREVRAWELLQDLLGTGTGAISTQVLQEFYVVMTRKIATPLASKEVRALIEQLEVLWVVLLDMSLIYRAIALVDEAAIGFWDGLIVGAAERAGCGVLYSEDLNSGQTYGGVTVRNPFISGNRSH